MARYKTMRQEDIDWMIANYGQHTVNECARELNVSERTIIRWARALELPDKRTMTKRIQDNNLKRKDCVVKKCCLVCEHFKSCSIGVKIDTTDACVLVCWDFELNKELMVD